MNKKISIFRIILIALGALAIVVFFAMPFLTLNKQKLIDELNENLSNNNVDVQVESLDLSEFYDQLSDADKEELIDNALEEMQESDPDTTRVDAEDFVEDYFSMKIPSFWSGFNITRFVMKAMGIINRASNFLNMNLGELADMSSSAFLLYLILLLPAVLGLVVLVLSIFTRKPAYITGIIAGVLMLITYGLHSLAAVGVAIADDEAEGYISGNPLYLIVLIIPLAMIVLSIIGLVKDKASAGAYDQGGYGQDGYGQGYDQGGYGQDGYGQGYDQGGYGQDGYGQGYDQGGYGQDGYGPGVYDDGGLTQSGYGAGGFNQHGQGALVGIKGDYLGATIPIADGENVTIGRNPAQSQVVIDNQAVSRLHCHVTYFADQGTYGVTDVSKFGVFDSRGNRLNQGQMTYLQPGDEIHIGKSHNVFRLQ